MAKTRRYWDEEKPYYEEVDDPAALYDAARAPGQLAQGQTEAKPWTPPAAGSGAVQGTPQGTNAAGQQQSSVPYADAASTYAPYIQEVMDRVLNRPAFSYDPETDPLYQSYAKQYRREGQRAAADTLGQAAALTGGRPSSWAVTASQQAGDRYAAALADKVPELRQLAYQMYADEGTQDRKNLDLLLGLADQEYQRGRDAVADEWKQREWDYGLSRDEESDRRYYDERDYERGRDAIADARYADETAYKRGRDAADDALAWAKFNYGQQQDALSRDMALAELGISMGDYSMLKSLGFTDEQIAAYTEKYNTQQAAAIAQQEEENAQAWAKILSGGSSGSSKTRPDYMDEDTWAGLQDYIARMGDDADVENYLAANGNLGFGNTDNALSGWELYNQETEKQTADDAMAALRDAGVPSEEIGKILPKVQWEFMKRNHIPNVLTQFDSYEEYLDYYVSYLIDEYGG